MTIAKRKKGIEEIVKILLENGATTKN